ncbi:MAG: sigma-54-dependent Fis family transcriptional regulator, partial [Desulfovibrio sp.]|nr:sigma-54-dependent Fis family transcriptional regulator [Desulfovibrio sp.]
ADNNLPRKTFSPEALELLSGYEWPGNIRQLENVVERCMIMASGDTVTVDDLPPEVKDEEAHLKNALDLLPAELNLAETLDRLEAALIRRALARADFVQVKAAERLGISKSLLQYKLRKYGITGH